MYKEVSLSNLPTHCSLKFASAVFAQLRSSVICTNIAFTVLIIEKTNTLTSTYTHTPYPYTHRLLEDFTWISSLHEVMALVNAGCKNLLHAAVSGSEFRKSVQYLSTSFSLRFFGVGHPKSYNRQIKSRQYRRNYNFRKKILNLISNWL